MEEKNICLSKMKAVMRNYFRYLSVGRFIPFLSIALLFSSFQMQDKPKVLVFSKTAGYHHASITNGNLALIKLGVENGFDVDTTADANWFTKDRLKKYPVVVFLNTTGDVLNNEQQSVFENYIHSGGSYVGIHSATDTEFDWPWYGKLAGAYFVNHPQQQEAVLNIENNDHPSTKHLPKQWKRKDEWYNFKNISNDIKVLITIDEKSYQGGTNGNFHPIAWFHEFEGGRAFYTELGHTVELYSDPLFLQHLLGGIQYAMNKGQQKTGSKHKSN
jgi:type 1 glutamine amidotransferase